MTELPSFVVANQTTPATDISLMTPIQSRQHRGKQFSLSGYTFGRKEESCAAFLRPGPCLNKLFAHCEREFNDSAWNKQNILFGMDRKITP